MTNRTLPALGVLCLLVLAGCSGLPVIENPTDNSQDQPDTTAEKIEYAMDNAETVETRVTTAQNFTIQDSNSTIQDLRQKQVQTQYNFTSQTSVSVGQGEQRFLDRSMTLQFERYQKNTTQYEKRQTSLQNETPTWNTTQVEQTPQEQFAPLANASFLSHFNATTNNSTIVYQIDLLNNSTIVNETLPTDSITQMDSFQPVLDTYVAEIYVNATTHRFTEVRIYAYGDLNQSDLETINSEYETGTTGEGEGVIAYTTQIEYQSYNETTNSTIPENATNQE